MAKTADLAIMFADISGSTRLFEKWGDSKARAVVANAIGLLAIEVERYEGRVIKTIGDEIMCTFANPNKAIQSACSMHERMEEGIIEGSAGAGQKIAIKIRIGLHFGSALLEGNDIFGDAVNVAARMAAQSKGGQIITTNSTVQRLNPMLSHKARFVDRAHIKGKKDVIDIYEIVWQEEDVTRMSTNMMQDIPNFTRTALRVSCKKKEIELNHRRLSIVMGRGQSCDLPVSEKLASRQHARIELRRDKFFVIDQSTNGTYISPDRSENIFLRREEVAIHGNGRISLGRSFKEKGAMDVIRFIESVK